MEERAKRATRSASMTMAKFVVVMFYCSKLLLPSQSFTKGDTISCLIDLDANTIGFAKNGKRFANAFSIAADLKREVFYPAVVLKNAEMLFNFGAEPLKYPISGYTPICEAPAECVRNSTIGASADYVRLNESCISRTGAGGGAMAPLKPAPNAPMCIIMEPSRELTQQTYAEVEKFKKYLPKPDIKYVGKFLDLANLFVSAAIWCWSVAIRQRSNVMRYTKAWTLLLVHQANCRCALR